MRLSVGCVAAIGAACVLAICFSDTAYSQTVRLNCKGIDQECLISEQPVPGVRIVREKDYKQRPAFYLSSNLYTTLAAGRETFNQFVSFDFIVPTGGGPLPHTHRNEWETFFVEEGTVTFTIGVSPTPPFNFIEMDVPAGTVIYGPQGPVHGFINKSGKPARIFSFAMPAGLDNFFHVAGTSVEKWDAPIPPITLEEILRTAFWAEQRGDALYPPNTPPPPVPATTPDHVVASINDPARPTKTGPFGETRRVLLTPNEVGNITGATAFCGPPPIPGRPGGTVEYSYISLPPTDFGANYISKNTEVFMTLGGELSLRFESAPNGNQPAQTRVVTLEPLTFVQIAPGVPFSMANLSRSTNANGNRAGGNARTLAISSISPVCPPSPFFP